MARDLTAVFLGLWHLIMANRLSKTKPTFQVRLVDQARDPMFGHKVLGYMAHGVITLFAGSGVSVAELNQSSVAPQRNHIHGVRMGSAGNPSNFFHKILILVAMVKPWMLKGLHTHPCRNLKQNFPHNLKVVTEIN